MKTINNYPLWTALITPLDAEGRLDIPSLTKLIKEQDSANNGLLLLGSTGEALNLSLNERKKVLETALALKLSVPIMVGVGGQNIEETSDWIKYLEGLKVDCYLMVTPIYAKPGEEGQYLWFKTLMDLSSRPVMLYNIPGRAGVALNHSSVKRLKQHPNAWAIKEASGSNAEFAKYREDAPNMKIYSGDDAMLPDHVKLGASGLISVASNIWPLETNLYTKLALTGELTSQSEEGKLWQEASNSLFIASNPVPAKALLYKLKKINTPQMKLPLSNKDLASTDLLEKNNKNICDWFSKKGKQSK